MLPGGLVAVEHVPIGQRLFGCYAGRPSSLLIRLRSAEPSAAAAAWVNDNLKAADCRVRLQALAGGEDGALAGDLFVRRGSLLIKRRWLFLVPGLERLHRALRGRAWASLSRILAAKGFGAAPRRPPLLGRWLRGFEK